MRYTAIVRLFAIAIGFLCFQGVPLGVAETRSSVKLESVVDGDTVRVLYRGERELIRLIGIDTPESRSNPRAKRQAEESALDEREILHLGERASKALSALVGPKAQLEVEFDVERRDRYGRLLGYVYMADGRMLNEEMLRLGYAKLYTVPPNVRYEKRLREAFRAGREAKRGLWSFEGFGGMEVSQRI
jgi:micrococcal nuclease